MKIGHFSSHDMHLIKWPLLILVIAVFTGMIWCGWTYSFLKIGRANLQKARSDRATMESLVRQSEEETELIHRFSGPYRALAAQGVIRNEDRLQLMEAIGDIRTRYNLYPIDLDIDKQRVVPSVQNGTATENGEAVSLRESNIRITMPLLHENDLIHLLDDLQQTKQGIFLVRKCSIKRTGSELETDERPQLGQNLNASLEILWLTLKQGKEEAKADDAKKLQGPPGL